MITKNLIDHIISFNAGRLTETLHLKYAALAENAFRFYRGTAHLFYDALTNQPSLADGPHAWLCGDLHLENFGTFRGDNRLVYFDLNDYDEAVIGPVKWELCRMVSSIFVAFKSLKIEDKKALKMALLFVRSYSATLARGKAASIETRHAKGIVGDLLNMVDKRRQEDILRKRTKKSAGRLEILLSHQKHLSIPDDRKDRLLEHIRHWLREDEHSPYNCQPIDCAFRIAGTSSLGLERYVILLKSVNKSGERFLLLDMKEAAPSSMRQRLTVQQPAFENEAERVVSIQKIMQDRCPALLSKSRMGEQSFIMQEMQPQEDNINFNLLRDRYKDMCLVIDNMAMLTASAQLRSSGFRGSAINDELRAFGERNDWHEAVIEYSRQYAETVQEDYRYYCAQHYSGVIQ